jgi:methylmalonyl-CoA decarboxylase
MAFTTRTVDGHVGTVTLTDGHRANCLGSGMIREILDGLDEFTAAEVRVAVIRAEPGTTVWSAGHDINEIPRDGRDPLTFTAPLEQLLRQVRRAPFPVMAAVDGSVWGGACDLMFSCDLIVATRRASFAMTPAKMGLPYNTAGLVHFLGVIPLHRVKEMYFTALPMTAEEAAGFGMVNRLADDADALDAAVAELAAQVCAVAPLVNRTTKAELTALGEAHNLSAEAFERLNLLRQEAWRSDDFQEGLDAFFAKRPPRFDGR